MATKSEILSEYSREIAEIRDEGERNGISNHEIESLISKSLEAAVPKPSKLGRLHSFICVLWWIIKVIIGAAVLYALVACHSPTQKTLSRHIQGYIYPFMRNLRKLTLPVLRAYPDLSEWHEEPCLVRNPLYGVRGPDCWPCEGVRSVLVLSKSPPNFAETYYHNGLPFVVQAGSSEVGWSELRHLAQGNSDILQHSTARVTAENFARTSLNLIKLLEIPERNVSELHPTAHLTWKITRSDSARVLRQLFPRPSFVPGHTEIAIQRFLFIDSRLAPAYSLPLTDFANVWVAQGTGVRLLGLAPSPHCVSRCHPVSLLLQPGDILFYNWQFWRPRSLPVQASASLSITYVGSFY